MQEKINRIKDNVVALPFNKKVILGGALAVGIAATSFTAIQLSKPNYVTMMSGLDPVSLQTIIPVLEAEGVPFSIAPNNTTLLVDRDSLQRATTVLAKNGLPAQPTSGYAHLNNSNSPYITKSTEEQISRQILEENLETSIMQLQLVEKAEVRLAVAKNSQFLRDVEPATASVVLTIKKGSSLNKSQISGIVKMIAYSVPNLPEENVIILDNTGRALSKGSEDGLGNGGTISEVKLYIEEQLKQKVIEVVAPIVGLDSVRVNIEAEINFDKVENTKEEPVETSVILSQQSEKSFDPNLSGAGGAVGAVANQPPNHASFDESPETTKANQTDAGVSHIKETTNYSVGKSITHTIKSAGEVERLNIAILFDESKIQQEELQQMIDKITSLTRSSIGFNEERGDIIQVLAAEFEKPVIEEKPPTIWYETKLAKDAIEAGKWGLAILMLWLMFWRPLINKLAFKEEPDVENNENRDQNLSGEHADEQEFKFSPQLSTEATEAEFNQEVTKAISTLSAKPIESQNVFQSWLADLTLEDLLNNEDESEDETDKESEDLNDENTNEQVNNNEK